MKILDVFVVMPNHVHGIIIINKTNGSADTTSATGNTDVETQNTDVETQNFASLLRIIRKEHYICLINFFPRVLWSFFLFLTTEYTEFFCFSYVVKNKMEIPILFN
jgi:REP element-mobilizing transposase RayT